MTPDSSHERLNAISRHLGGIQRYLEIGVAKGSTFFAVQASQKHAVDPRFRFDPTSRRAFSNETYHPITSDQYFHASLGKEKPFDLIFLDGLHTYSQTLRDFLASQALAHSRTVWLIDDTVPSDPIAGDPDLQRVQAARRVEGRANDQTWMGDVFKVVAFIDTFCPQYTCLTLEGHGQTVVLPVPKPTQNGRFSSVDEIGRLTYVDVLLLRDSLLAPVSLDHVLKTIAQLPKPEMPAHARP